MSIILRWYGSFKAAVFKECAVLNKRNVGDLAFPACSGRRIGSMDLSQPRPGPGCVVAEGNLGTLGRAVPRDVVDCTSNVFSKPEKVMRAQVQYAKRAAATGIQVPVTMAGASLAGMTFPLPTPTLSFVAHTGTAGMRRA